MTVKKLISLLKQFPQNLEVLETKYSDYQLMQKESWSIIEAVNTSGAYGYIMRNHYKMTEELKPLIKKYLHFRGN